jgi:DeoR family fructose operon transcriptional repressor
MAKLMAHERQSKIVELLNDNGSLNMSELAGHLQVSKETIRRELLYLNEFGSVKKIHGGATASYDLKTQDMAVRISSDLSIKDRICQKALEYLPEQGVIFLDTGSTVMYFAGLLSKKSGLIIITNSLGAANALVNSNNTVHITGGQLNSINMSMEGYQTVNFLSTIKVELAVLGCSGFEQHNGPTSANFLDVQIKRMVLKNAKTSMVLTDSSKSRSTSFTQYATWSEIDYLITDSDISPDVVSGIESLTSVVIV